MLYESHFGFTAEPFSADPDPRALFRWPGYEEAFANLEMGLNRSGGLLLLVGEQGSGKTTLLRDLVSKQGPRLRTAVVGSAERSAGQAVHTILRELEIPFRGGTLEAALEALRDGLRESRVRNEKVAILADDAESVSPRVLELLLLLGGLKFAHAHAPTVVLAGRPGLLDVLDQPSLLALAPRGLTANHLDPLTLDQTRLYVRQRLGAVGGTGSELDEGATRRIHQFSGGLPGRVNALGHQALTLAFDRGQKWADQTLVTAPTSPDSGTEPDPSDLADAPGPLRLRKGVVISLLLAVVTGALLLFLPRSAEQPARATDASPSPADAANSARSVSATPPTEPALAAPQSGSPTPETAASTEPRSGEAARGRQAGTRSRSAAPPPADRIAPLSSGAGDPGSTRRTQARNKGPRPVTGTVSTDPEFARLVKEWTTKPEFLSPLVDFLPLKKGIPTPKDVLGRYVGTPNRLTTVAEAYSYYRALEKASPRVKIVMMGKTDEGRDQFIVNISNEQTIRDLELYRGYLGQLADPRKTTPEAVKDVIAKAKPMYYVSGGQHSPETGPPEMLMELAYRLVADDSPMYQGIRDNVIVAINPVVEPDGRDRIVDWYHRHKVDETDERTASPGPPYWGKYVFHDNNRDINYSQVTMKNVLDWYLQWHPPIMHDLHESVPFMYTFSGQAPQNPTLDPILYSELPWFSNYEKSQMAKYGMPGVWDWGFVDMWSPGYLAFMSSNHNGMIRMYETFGNGGATTMKRKVAGEGFGPDQTSREWYRPWPPYKEVVWSMRNNTNYMETGVLSALELTSKFPKVILENFYKKSFNSIESGKKDAPYGYVIPPGKDQTRVAMLINLLRIQGIEVGKATAEVSVKEGKFPAGSYVIKRDQPYGRLAKILLEKQVFPDANLRTYDDTGWTMGLMAHTDVKEIADLAILQAAVEPVTMVKLAGAQSGAGRYVAALNFGANQMATLRFRFPKVKTLASEKATKVGDTAVPAGSLWFDTQGADAAAIKAAVESLGLTAVATDTLPAVATHEVDLPRLAVYSTWGNTQEVGWIRHAFDYYGIPFTLIYKEQVRAGNLAKDFDVILIPNQGRTSKGLVFDVPNRGKALPYKKDPKFPSLGGYGESDDITGGMGLEGAAELDKFVNGGGSLVTLAASSYFPPDFGLAKQIDARAPSAAFYAPGPIIEAEITAPEHPIFYGYSNKTVTVRYGNGPLLNVPEIMKDRVLMKYPGGDRSVVSGLFKGANEIRERPAIVDLPQGKGQIVLFAGNPCYRWQNHGEFGMLFNTVLHWNDLLASKAPAAPEKPAAAGEKP